MRPLALPVAITLALIGCSSAITVSAGPSTSTEWYGSRSSSDPDRIGRVLSTTAWSVDTTIGNPVALVTGDQSSPAAVPDGSGGCILMWLDGRNAGDLDIYCQRIGANGDTLWGSGGRPVCVVAGIPIRMTMIADGQGGAFFAWFDSRVTSPGSGYLMQHIGPNGLPRWTVNGIKPVSTFNSQFSPYICRDTSGGVFLAYASGAGPGAAIQHLDSTGTSVAGTIGIRTSPAWPLGVAPDGVGGVIVGIGFGSVGFNDLAIQRITGTMTPLWTIGGVTVCTASGAQSPLDMLPDGSGGAILAWEDHRVPGSDIYAQHMSASGVQQWGVDGMVVCNADTAQSGPRLQAMTGGGVVAVWRDYRSLPATSLYAQRIGSTGALAWAANGVPVCSANLAIDQYTLGPRAGDDVFVAWNTLSGSGADVFAQDLDGAGVKQWGAYGSTVCRGPGDQISRTAASDGVGGLFVAYRDARVPSNPDLYANHVGPDGHLAQSSVSVIPGAPTAFETLGCTPNPARGPQVISFGGSLPVPASIEVFDVSGRRRTAGVVPARSTSWTWSGRSDDGAGVGPGLYLVRVHSGNHVAMAKVLRIE